MKRIYFSTVIFIALLLAGCGGNKVETQKRVIIGISSDIESFNPMYAFGVNEGEISELLYMSLVKHDWNANKGRIETSPMLAESWEWGKDSSYIVVNLRDDVYWTDSVKFDAGDVIFSYDVYSDPAAESKYYGSFDKFYTDKNNHIITEKTFTELSPYKLKINFLPDSHPDLFDIDMPIIPKHVFEKVDRKHFSSAEQNFNPVSDGPYKLSKWAKNQSIILTKNPNCFFKGSGNISEIIFKIVPDYKSRLTQLMNGEIDLDSDIKPEDVKELKRSDKINLAAVEGRNYDYVAWNNIEPSSFGKNIKPRPNILFGDPVVRKAMTYAINRKEILSEFMDNYGQLAVAPVSPIFKGANDPSIKPYSYDPEKAKELLASRGWKDSNNDGILEKGNLKFEFTLYYLSGNPRRDFAAQVIKNNLKQVGINIKIESQEMSTFVGGLNGRKYNAWMAGWFVPVPVDLKPYWYSDPKEAPLNFAGYSDSDVDKILNEIESQSSESVKDKLFIEFQRIIHKDEPVTFLYWVDKIVAYSSRLDNLNINPLGVVKNPWNWKVK